MSQQSLVLVLKPLGGLLPHNFACTAALPKPSPSESWKKLVQAALPHSHASVQPLPLGLSGAQVPLSHHEPLLQSCEHTPPLHEERHAPAPSQVYAPHSFWGSVFKGRNEQVPRVPARLQASQVPSQAVSQQTPSVHSPLSHSPSPPHEEPWGFFATQVLLEHQKPSVQPSLLAQVVGQPGPPAQT